MGNKKMWKVLIVDDDIEWKDAYKNWLIELIKDRGLEGHFNQTIECANDGRTATDLIEEDKNINLVISDVFMAPYYENGRSTAKDGFFGGLWLAMQINSIRSKSKERDIKCLLVSDKDDAGVFFENLPLSWKEWLKFVAKEPGFTKVNLQGKAYDAIEELAKISKHIPLIGNIEFVAESADSKEVFKRAEKVAGSRSNTGVLLLGDTGTGKEVIAQFIHSKSSRKERLFIPVNCGAIPEQLLEAELFGYEKGAFTGAEKQRIGNFEQADGGTLFLDEIGDASLAFQVKLLRVIQEEKVKRLGGNEEIVIDVRIIAGTNNDIENMVRDGSFREDLYYRLNVVEIHMRPLNARRDDIPPLIDLFLRRYNQKEGRSHIISNETRQQMQSYDWPGNIRQLEKAIEAAVVMEDDSEIIKKIQKTKSKKIYMNTNQQDLFEIDIPDDGIIYESKEHEFRKAYLIAALKKAKGVKQDAAELLNLDISKFNRLCKEHKLNEYIKTLKSE